MFRKIALSAILSSALLSVTVPVEGFAASGQSTARLFTPPSEDSLPTGPFGDLVREGEKIFTHAGQFAGKYVGNDLTCESCHLDRGRKAYAAPLWGAYVRYPRFRSKNGKVSRLGERIQGCFRFSMNGRAPSLESRTIRSLVAYSFWMSKGAPVGETLRGQEILRLPASAERPDPFRGRKVYAARCALCHAADGWEPGPAMMSHSLPSGGPGPITRERACSMSLSSRGS